jgi:hypothetical protein
LENKIESLEKKVLSIEKVQGESLNRISDLLNSMEENQKLLLSKLRKRVGLVECHEHAESELSKF